MTPIAWISPESIRVLNESKHAAMLHMSRDQSATHRIPLYAALVAAPANETTAHPDDLAVDRFAQAMKSKLAAKRAQGYGGWDDPELCPSKFLSRKLREHVEKGDPVDVANFGMMLHQRGERISTAGQRKKAFNIGDRVQKKRGSSWRGRVVGFYSTELTPVGYCVESEREPGSVQIYPEAALSLLPPPDRSDGHG